MGKHRIFNLTQKLRVAAAILMVSSLGLFYPGTVSSLRAQSPNKATPSSPAGGPKEGIKVHGHWTIDIRNPDGKLVTHHQFENALHQAGASSLKHFIDRRLKAGEWRIRIASISLSNQPCFSNGSQPSSCFIYETQSQSSVASDTSSFKTLTMGFQPGGLGGVTRSGTATAARTGAIDWVSTELALCEVDTQGVCNPTLFEPFTVKSLATPINVVAGQIIQVKVVISFS